MRQKRPEVAAAVRDNTGQVSAETMTVATTRTEGVQIYFFFLTAIEIAPLRRRAYCGLDRRPDNIHRAG